MFTEVKRYFEDSKEQFLKLSPDGKYVSYVEEIGEYNFLIIVKITTNKIINKICLSEKKCNILYNWTFKENTILLLSDEFGAENWGLYKLNVVSGDLKKIYSKEGIQVRLVSISRNRPNEVLIGINERIKLFHDIYVLDLSDDTMDILFLNNEFLNCIFDLDFRLKIISRVETDKLAYYSVISESEKVRLIDIPFSKISTNYVVYYDFKKNDIYVKVSDNRDDMCRIICIDCISGRSYPFFEVINKEIKTVFVNNKNGEIEGVETEHILRKWEPLSKWFKIHINNLVLKSKFDMCNIEFYGKTDDEKLWLIKLSSAQKKEIYYIYNTMKGSLIKVNMRESKCDISDEIQTSQMYPIIMTVENSHELICYYTIPQEYNVKKTYPMVVLVHGGPWTRDSWGYNARHQWLSNRNYFVLSVNYRGSAGLGNKILQAGKLEFGKGVQADILYAVNEMKKMFPIDSERVGIMGGSYGGYEALMAISLYPYIYKCAISINGYVDLTRLFEKMPDHMCRYLPFYKEYFGDFLDEKYRLLLEERSPVNNISKLDIDSAIMLINSKEDIRSDYNSARIYYEKLVKKNIYCEKLFFNNEGHSVTIRDNKVRMYQMIEKFLHKHLKGVFFQ